MSNRSGASLVNSSEDTGSVSSHDRNVNTQILSTLNELGGKLTSDQDILFEGTRFVFPQNMTPMSALNWLITYCHSQEEENRYSRRFPYRPLDGAHAVMSAFRRVFGTFAGKTTYGFFGPNPPQMVDVKIALGEQIGVPWGTVEVPLIEGTMELRGASSELGPVFAPTITAKRKYAHAVEGIWRLIEEELKTNSIYRGKAFYGGDDPDFVDINAVDPNKVAYTEQVLADLNAHVWSLLNFTDEFERNHLPLKRAVLLEGPYGTGKTIAATLTAQCAVTNDWTFIFCRPGKDDIDQVMQTARMYEPAVVFFEDIDTVSSSGVPLDVTRLLDNFDGMTAKGAKLVCLMTTNHVHNIHRGMLRPGRLDAVIHIGAADRPAVQRLIEGHCPEGSVVVDTLDMDAIHEAMEGYLPAYVVEAIQRAVRYALVRSGGRLNTKLVTEDFVNAANGLRPQFEMQEGAGEGKVPDTLTQAFASLVDTRVKEALGTAEIVDGDGDKCYEIKTSQD